MYRDKDAAAEERISALEDQVAVDVAEIEELKSALAKRDQHIDSLVSTFAGRRRAAYRRWRALSIVALVSLVGAVVVAEVRVRAAERAAPRAREELAQEPPSAPLLADPLDESRATSPAELDESVRAPPSVAPDVLSECAPDDLMCHMRRAQMREEERQSRPFNQQRAKKQLLGKLEQGTATETELRMLKAICMNDGDRECRQRARSALDRLSEGAP